MRKAYIFPLVLLVGLLSATMLVPGVCSGYRPVLTGDFEVGDRLYTDTLDDLSEEILDRYYYRRCWLKYKQKLSPGEYYYFKTQYYHKEYEDETIYDNISLYLWGNYTKKLSEKVRNRWLLTLKNKDYYHHPSKTYRSTRIKYQLDIDYRQDTDYTIYLQRQWNDYLNEDTNDNFEDRLSLALDHEISERFEVNTTYQIKQQQYGHSSARSNKYGQKLSVGFKYEL